MRCASRSPAAAVCAGALASLLLVASCGGGGGGGGFRLRVFPLGFLPVQLLVGADAADVAFDAAGDLLAVAGDDRFFRLQRADGALFETDLSGDPDCAGAALRSLLADGDTLYLGAADGRLFAMDEDGDCALLVDLGGGPLTGLALVPRRFALPRGQIIAAAGADGVLAVDPSAEGGPAVTPLTPASPNLYVDVAFFNELLFAIDRSAGELVTIDPERDPVVQTFADDLGDPVGLGVDRRNDEVLVADAGVDALRSLPIAGAGAFADLAPYDFSATAPNGLAFDGSGTLAFATRGSVVLRAARVPPLSPENFGLLVEGPDVGYGDMEFSADGSLLLVANEEGSTDEPVRAPDNFVFVLDRNGIDIDLLASGIGAEGERLLGLARDPWTGDLYLGSDLGNVWRLDERNRATLFATPGAAVLGLEMAPPASEFSGRLVASTEDGEVVALDLGGGAGTPVGALDGRLSDLVFASDGTLYVVVDREPGDGGSAIWRRPDGGAFAELASLVGQGQADGIEIDEGGERLLVTAGRSLGADALLEVTFAGGVRALLDLEVDDGFFPSGVVQDGLGRVVVRAFDGGTAVDAFVLPFPL